MDAVSFFILLVDVPYEVGVSDLSAIWRVMFANWENVSSSFDSFVCWTVVSDTIGEETSKFICIFLLAAVTIRFLG